MGLDELQEDGPPSLNDVEDELRLKYLDDDELARVGVHEGVDASHAGDAKNVGNQLAPLARSHERLRRKTRVSRL